MQHQKPSLKRKKELSNPNKKKQKASSSNQQQEEVVNTAMMPPSTSRGDDQSLLLFNGTTNQQQENVSKQVPSSIIIVPTNTMISSSGSTSIFPSSIDVLGGYDNAKVIELFSNINTLRLSLDKIPPSLKGSHLRSAIDTYNRVLKNNFEVEAKEEMIHNLMRNGKITHEDFAEFVANWLVKYIKQLADNKRLEREFNVILSDLNLKFFEVYTQCYCKINKRIPPIPFEFTNYDAFVSQYCNDSDIVTLEEGTHFGERRTAKISCRQVHLTRISFRKFDASEIGIRKNQLAKWRT